MKWWRSRISIAPPICLPRSPAGSSREPTSFRAKKTGPRRTARGPELVRSYDNLRQLLSEDTREHLLEHTVERELVTRTTTPCATNWDGLRIPSLHLDTQAIRGVAEVQELVLPIHIGDRRGQNLAIPPQLDGPPF